MHRQDRLLGPGRGVQRTEARLDEWSRRLPKRGRHLHWLHHAGLSGQVHAIHGRAARRSPVDVGGADVRADGARAAELHEDVARPGAALEVGGLAAHQRLRSAVELGARSIRAAGMNAPIGRDQPGAAQAPTEDAVAEAQAVLVQLAGALFPHGEPDLSQLTWNAAPARADALLDGSPGVEKKLHAADLRYRTLVEQIPAVTFLAVLGEGDNEIYVSPYIESLLGFTQQEWLENPFLWYSQLHPDDRQIWHDEFARGVQTGGPFRAECRFLARDGRVVWVRGEARLVKDELGRPLFLQGVAFDITESKRTHSLELQAAVRSTEQRYRDLVEQLDAIFWEIDAHTGRFTFVSRGARAILGFPPEQWISDPGFWLTRVHAQDRAVVRRTWARALESGGEHEFEFRAVHVSGSEIWLHARMRAPSLPAPTRYMFGVMLDVTERKRTEAERAALLAAAEEARTAAESANRAKDEFLATMSHELKTPLNALIGYAQLLRARQMPPAMMDNALESIERNAQAQAKLVEDLLDVSRLITGKLHVEIHSIDLAEVLDTSLDTVRLAAAAKRITLLTAIDRSGLIVSGDAARLRQVVWNLLSNAVKFTPEGGRIEVQLERIGGYANIRISDNGHGIAPEFLPHVFERFRQADSSLTRHHGGMGLGLAIVRQIVELHGGSVKAESAGRGQGASFTVSVPLSGLRAGAEAAEAALSKEPLHTLDGIHILVVDDDRDARELLRTVFAQSGAHVTVASSAAEAEA